MLDVPMRRSKQNSRYSSKKKMNSGYKMAADNGSAISASFGHDESEFDDRSSTHGLYDGDRKSSEL